MQFVTPLNRKNRWMNSLLRSTLMLVPGLLWSDCGIAEDSPRRHALVVVGIPGDQEHRERFLDTTRTWRSWLVEVAGVDEQDLVILSAADPEAQPATAKNLEQTVEMLRDRAGEGDALWVFLLGHGSQDSRQSWFHLSGPDLDALQWANLFADFDASEQVFWFTQAGSGGFLKTFSAPGRIVITATDTEGEVNETRFPHRLAEQMQLQLDPPQPDSGGAAPATSGQVQEPEQDETEGQASEKRHAADEKPSEGAAVEASRAGEESITNVLQLFRATASRVNDEFTSSRLVPTEHAQLDDNGDHVGTEANDLEPETVNQAPVESALVAPRFPIDGVVAQRTFISRQRATRSRESGEDALPSDRTHSQLADPTP